MSPLVKGRLQRCRKQMKGRKVNALLVTNPKDYFYLAGFTGEDSAILVTPKEIHVITDGRFQDVVKDECPWARIWLRKLQLGDEIANVCRELKLRTLAVQGHHMTIEEQAALAEKNGSTRLATAPSIVQDMRLIKDETELSLIRKSLRVAEQAFLALRDQIRLGMTEIEMAAILEYEMRMRGSPAPSFGTIVAEGPSAALPHARPGKRKVKKGSAILFDWGATLGHYCSDLTRMVFVGSIPPKFEEIYRVVLEAQRRGIAAVKPGERMCDVHEVARACIADAGFGDNFTHGLGHGMGLDIHEAPSLSWRSDAKLKEGMVVTVEPGIYLPGVGGVRIEDDVVVTSGGCRVLSRLTKKLEESVIEGRT